MALRAKYYAATLLVLGTLCAVYQLTFVAWLEPLVPEPVELVKTTTLRRNSLLASLFPEDAWQHGNCKRLQSRDGALLFEHWEQVGDDQWKLWPLTVVLGVNSDTPLVLDAQEGAEIKFAESLDVMSGGAPPIERGRMIGEVRIRSYGQGFSMPAWGDQAAAPADLEIISSDFGIDSRKLWTTQAIQVRMGDIKLSGRDLTLHLTPLGRVQGSDGTLSILNRMELIYLDELSVPLPSGGLWRSLPGMRQQEAASARRDEPSPQESSMRPRRLPSSDAQPQAADSAGAPAEARLQCAGRVVFHFRGNELTLRDDVVLQHRVGETVDRFVCELLTLHFNDLAGAGSRRPANANDSAAPRHVADLDDYLQRLVAEGRPARIELPSFAAEVAAERLELDVGQGRLEMSGGAGARISYAGHTWRFKQCSYHFNPAEPTQLGSFQADGSGLVELGGAMPLPVRRLRWSGGIRMDQTNDSGQVALRVDGDVTALLDDDGEASCDSALLILQMDDTDLTASEMADKVRPTRFQASGQVRVRSSMVDVATDLLRLYFDLVPPDDVADTRHGDRLWVRQADEAPRDDQPGPRMSLAGSASRTMGQRPTIQGDTINAKMRVAGKQLAATDLNIVGNVTLRHLLDTPAGPLPAILSGDRLQMRDEAGKEVLQIGSGVDSPAQLALGDGHFIGPLIQVRLADNIVWIKDAGEFQVPTEILPRFVAERPQPRPLDDEAEGRAAGGDSPADSGGTPIRWLAAPRCRWRGQMLFDGSQVTLSGGVMIRGVMMAGADQDVWDVETTADRIEVALDRAVEMRQLDQLRSATIDSLGIIGSDTHPLIVTANQLTTAGTRKSRHIISLPEMIVRPATSGLTGSGPGWFRAWMRTAEVNMGDRIGQRQRLDENPLAAMHLVFRDALESNLADQSLEFIGNVRIAGRQVDAWDDLVDVESMQGLRLGDSTLDCDRLRFGVDATRRQRLLSQRWEMEANGNVVFQSRNERGLFSGDAARASYTAAKEILLVEGLPGRSANLRQTLPSGAPGFSGSGRGSMNTRTLELNFEFDRVHFPTPNLQR